MNKIEVYTPTPWNDGGLPAINADNLRKIESGIETAITTANSIIDAVNLNTDSISSLEQTVEGDTVKGQIERNKNNIAEHTTSIAQINSKNTEQDTNITALTNIVTNNDTGLVKRVGTLEQNSATKTELSSATSRISSIETDLPNTYATKQQLSTVSSELSSNTTNVNNVLSSRIASVETRVQTLENNGGAGGGGSTSWTDIQGKPEVFVPSAHASSDSSTYGAATTTVYGHVKIDNGDVSNKPHANGVAAGMDHTHSEYATKDEATQSSAGLLSSADKLKLDGIDEGADRTTIVDNLTSTSATSALSANQGRLLKSAIDSLTTDLGTLGGGDMLKATYDTDGDGKVNEADNATKLDGHSISEFSMNGHKHEITSVNGLQTELNGKADTDHVHDDYAKKAFKSIVVDDVTVNADDHQDSFELVAGNNITLTADASTDKITINALDTHATVTNNAPALSWGKTSTVGSIDGVALTVTMPANPDTNVDTKNTAGASNTSSKIYLVGALSQGSNPVTYSHDTAYVGTDGCLYSNSTKVLTSHQSVTNKSATLGWGTTSTIASIGGTNITVTMPENPDTTYSAGTGITLSGTTFSNSGVRSISASSHKLTVNTNGTTATLDLSYGSAGTSLGLVKSGGDVTISSGVITVNDDSHNHTIENIDNLQTTLDSMLTWKAF